MTQGSIPTIYINRRCLVIYMADKLEKEALKKLQDRILHKVCQSELKGVIIDLTAMSFTDRKTARLFFDTARMAQLLGVKTVLTGFSPGIASTLTDLGEDADDLDFGFDLEDGFSRLGV